MSKVLEGHISPVFAFAQLGLGGHSDKACPASTDCVPVGPTCGLCPGNPSFAAPQGDSLGSPAWASASSMDWVVKSVTRPARRSRSRLQMWCLEQGSSPAVGSSKSNTCKGQRDQSSLGPSCVYLAQFHACITSFHAFDDLTQRRKCILKYWLFLLLFLLLQYYLLINITL